MAERLPISLPEVYRRVNNIEDPVKRAGAQAFAGIYAPVLKLPEYRNSSLNKTIMRRRALRAKDWAIKEITDELGIPKEEPFDYSELDAIAQQAGLVGIDLLNLPARTRNALAREKVNLATLSMMPTYEIDSLRNISYQNANQVRRGLEELKGLSREQVEERIADIHRQIEEARKPKPKHEQGDALLGVTQKIFEGIGHRLPHDVSIISLWDGDEAIGRDPDWNEVMNQLRPNEKGAVNGALSLADSAKLKTVGDIRSASPEKLAELGPHRAQFFREAFGAHPQVVNG